MLDPSPRMPSPRSRAARSLRTAIWFVLLAACGGGGGGGGGSSGTVGGGDPPPDPLPIPTPCSPIDLSGPPLGPPSMTPCSGGCTCTSKGLVPLTTLGQGTYFGVEGGLYCGGSNQRPAAHEAAGVAIATAIGPLDAAGAPSASGRYVFVSIGMSNTTQEFSAFLPLANVDPAKDPRLVLVDGAQGGQAVDAWSDPANATWTTLDARLSAAGVTGSQVVVAWIKLAAKSPTGVFPQSENALATGIAQTVRNARARYPNLRLAYLSSRIYAGYATTTLNPEPYAYQSGFAVKKVILDQIAGTGNLAYDAASGPVVAPWIAWGPYLWADGTTPNADGLSWGCSDLQADGTHPSASGQAKVAQRLLTFVKTDSTASLWFVGP